MAENKKPGVGASTTPSGTAQPTSPLTSTRSRDEIERDIQARRDKDGAASNRPDPATVRERTREDAEAHRAAHSGGGDVNRAVPQAAAHDPARTDPARSGSMRDEPSRTDAYRRDPDDTYRDRREVSRRYEDDRDKSSAELEREVERERHELRRTLDQLRARTSPGQIVDQAFEYARDAGGGDFVRNLGRTVRDNPLPVVLAGVSLGWLMMASSSGSSYRGAYGASYRGLDRDDHGPSVRDRAAGLGHDLSERAGHASERASDMASSAREGLHRAADSASSSAASAYASVSETGSAVAARARDSMGYARDTMHSARDTVHSATESARSSMHHVSDYAHDTRESMQRGFSRMAEEQPLALGALGIAVGAAIAAMLPPTRLENRLMGPASTRLKEAVRHSAEEQYEHAREVVETTAHEIAEEFESRGMSAEAAADAAVGATRKAGDAAKEIAEGAKSEIETKGAPKTSDSRAGGTAGPAKGTGQAGTSSGGAARSGTGTSAGSGTSSGSGSTAGSGTSSGSGSTPGSGVPPVR
jgi:hypothetical protein